MQDYLVFGFSCSPFTFLTRLYAAQHLRNLPGGLTYKPRPPLRFSATESRLERSGSRVMVYAGLGGLPMECYNILDHQSKFYNHLGHKRQSLLTLDYNQQIYAPQIISHQDSHMLSHHPKA